MFSNFSHPALKTSSSKVSFALLLAMRSAFFALLVALLDYALDFGTSPTLLCSGVIVGTIVASLLAFSNLRGRGFLLLLGLIFILHKIAFWIGTKIIELNGEQIFSLYHLQEHGDLLLLLSGIAAVTTWAFWWFRHVITLELLLMLLGCVYLLSGHRNFHFDRPQLINTLAWHFGYSPLAMFIIVGSVAAFCLIFYATIASLPSKPIADPEQRSVKVHRVRPNLLLAGSVVGIAAILLFTIAQQLFVHYSEVVTNRLANGVGQADKEGLSPLGFHSALGSTKQPAALLRLEGDYADNPHSPMLYLRESALTEFNGRELVYGGASWSVDASNTKPDQPFQRDPDPILQDRSELVQSIYLLSDHNFAFAVDYPISIRRLQNPNRKRFKAAYRAISLAPSASIEDLHYEPVGDPRWSVDELDHYLAPHTDPRYGELAKEVTKGITLPVRQAAALAKHLSKVAIYTLTPEHELEANEDPVAAFLFGDKRGYCVHFAHASVYMLRSLGIPARIATGYLTDLSQARDGHVLLRMSDRHAWAEINISGKGWIPFDTQPEQVENFADPQVDMNMLEELMSMLDPDEDILPNDVIKDELNVYPEESVSLPDPRVIFIPIIGTLLFMIFFKLYLRYGWLLAGNGRSQLRRSYVALASTLYDLGYRRQSGETREEYRKRLNSEVGQELLLITSKLNSSTYSNPESPIVSSEEVRGLREVDFKTLAKFPLWRRFLAFLNPSSLLVPFSGRSW